MTARAELEKRCADAEQSRDEAQTTKTTAANSSSEMEGEITRLTERISPAPGVGRRRGRWDRRVREGDSVVAEVRAQLSKAKAKAEKMEAECAAATSQLESAKAEAAKQLGKMSELEIEMHRQRAQRANQRAQALENTGGGDEALLPRRGITHARRRHHRLFVELIQFRFRERK